MRRRISCSERSFESVACCADANFTVVMLKPPVEMSGTTHRTDQGVQICGANKKNFKCCSLRTVGGDESVEPRRRHADIRRRAMLALAHLCPRRPVRPVDSRCQAISTVCDCRYSRDCGSQPGLKEPARLSPSSP